MSRSAWSPVSLAVLCAGAGYARPTRLLADQIAESVCGVLMAGGVRAEVEVLELGRLAADLAQCATRGQTSLDLREAIAAVVAADGLVVATPVVGVSPSDVFESFFDVLDGGVLSGMPVLLAVNSGSRWQPPDIGRVLRKRLACLYAEPVPTVVVAGLADWEGPAPDGSTQLRERIDQAAVELAAAIGSHPR
ncbi:NAD(P)H-dependent oxidoreductase [Actinophytocola sp.]|uniref:NAD(P)H-dependent oxidoreductase n=1 Tax=Actinophytocola sp. TaxID=1872138 RepID=UPI002ED0E2A6